MKVPINTRSPAGGILRYDGATGAYIDTFIDLGDRMHFVRSFALGQAGGSQGQGMTTSSFTALPAPID